MTVKTDMYLNPLDLLDPAPATAASVLAAIRRANLDGRLFPHPACPKRRAILQALRHENAVERVPGNATSLGGWWLVEQ